MSTRRRFFQRVRTASLNHLLKARHGLTPGLAPISQSPAEAIVSRFEFTPG